MQSCGCTRHVVYLSSLKLTCIVYKKIRAMGWWFHPKPLYCFANDPIKTFKNNVCLWFKQFPGSRLLFCISLLVTFYCGRYQFSKRCICMKNKISVLLHDLFLSFHLAKFHIKNHFHILNIITKVPLLIPSETGQTSTLECTILCLSSTTRCISRMWPTITPHRTMSG